MTTKRRHWHPFLVAILSGGCVLVEGGDPAEEFTHPVVAEFLGRAGGFPPRRPIGIDDWLCLCRVVQRESGGEGLVLLSESASRIAYEAYMLEVRMRSAGPDRCLPAISALRDWKACRSPESEEALRVVCIGMQDQMNELVDALGGTAQGGELALARAALVATSRYYALASGRAGRDPHEVAAGICELVCKAFLQQSLAEWAARGDEDQRPQDWQEPVERLEALIQWHLVSSAAKDISHRDVSEHGRGE